MPFYPFAQYRDPLPCTPISGTNTTFSQPSRLSQYPAPPFSLAMGALDPHSCICQPPAPPFLTLRSSFPGHRIPWTPHPISPSPCTPLSLTLNPRTSFPAPPALQIPPFLGQLSPLDPQTLTVTPRSSSPNLCVPPPVLHSLQNLEVALSEPSPGSPVIDCGGGGWDPLRVLGQRAGLDGATDTRDGSES